MWSIKEDNLAEVIWMNFINQGVRRWKRYSRWKSKFKCTEAIQVNEHLLNVYHVPSPRKHGVCREGQVATCDWSIRHKLGVNGR